MDILIIEMYKIHQPAFVYSSETENVDFLKNSKIFIWIENIYCVLYESCCGNISTSFALIVCCGEALFNF